MKKYKGIILPVLLFFVGIFLFLRLGRGSSSASFIPVAVEPGVREADAAGLADQLYEAMKGFGTDEASIRLVRDRVVANPNLLAAVYNAFGKRNYFLFGENSWFGSPLTLRGWLSEELSAKEFDVWSKMFDKLGYE